MNNIDWINDVIGKPWADRATGPDAYDCWGLVIDSFARVDENPLPEVDGYAEGDAIENIGGNEKDSGNWQEVGAAEDGAVFCVYDGDSMIHVGRIMTIDKAGLYAVHSRGEGGQVRADRLSVIERAYENIKYLKRAE